MRIDSSWLNAQALSAPLSMGLTYGAAGAGGTPSMISRDLRLPARSASFEAVLPAVSALVFAEPSAMRYCTISSVHL